MFFDYQMVSWFGDLFSNEFGRYNRRAHAQRIILNFQDRSSFGDSMEGDQDQYQKLIYEWYRQLETNLTNIQTVKDFEIYVFLDQGLQFEMIDGLEK